MPEIGRRTQNRSGRLQQIPFDYAQGRLSTHHPQAEESVWGPKSFIVNLSICCYGQGLEVPERWQNGSYCSMKR